MAQKVTLREKVISTNKIALYLDYYPPIFNSTKNKTTRREFFNKHLIPEILYEKISINHNGKIVERLIAVTDKSGKARKRKLSQEELIHNRETRSFANQLLNARRSQYDKQELYNPLEKEQFLKQEKEKKFGDKDFIEFFIKESEKRKTSTKGCWNSLLSHLNFFFNGKIKFSDLTVEKCDNFKTYLLKTANISQNTASLYYTIFKTTIKQAYIYDYIKFDINKYVKPVKQIQSKRNYLTLEELQSLAAAPCHTNVIKRAALFSAQTGLRFSDIHKLTWQEVIKRNDGYYLEFRQQKTSTLETMPISEDVLKLADPSINKDDKLFKGLKYNGSLSLVMKLWLKEAKIDKHITFHCFRHTYATLQLALGTDIYTVSKMLGHSNLSTTQIYAKVLDDTKRETTTKIKLILN